MNRSLRRAERWKWLTATSVTRLTAWRPNATLPVRCRHVGVREPRRYPRT